MKFKNVLWVIFALFFGFALLVNCVHKKNKESSGQKKAINEVALETSILNTLTPMEKEKDWTLLFDGKTLNGWRGFKSDSIGPGWIVDRGNLMSLGKGGDLGGDIITDKEFGNFNLKLEWKLSKGGNSGILFHVLEGNYPTVYATGPEYQLIDDIGYPGKLEDWQTCGANYAMNVPENPKIKPALEWNTSELIVNGPHVIQYLNGSKVVEYDMWTNEWKQRVQNGKWKDYPGYGLAKKGHISLQDHGSKIWFRNIKIKEL